MSDDTAIFPLIQALQKKKKGSIISEPRSADNFSPVMEEFEEDQEVMLLSCYFLNLHIFRKKSRRLSIWSFRTICVSLASSPQSPARNCLTIRKTLPPSTSLQV